MKNLRQNSRHFCTSISVDGVSHDTTNLFYECMFIVSLYSRQNYSRGSYLPYPPVSRDLGRNGSCPRHWNPFERGETSPPRSTLIKILATRRVEVLRRKRKEKFVGGKTRVPPSKTLPPYTRPPNDPSLGSLLWSLPRSRVPLLDPTLYVTPTGVDEDGPRDPDLPPRTFSEKGSLYRSTFFHIRD